MRRVSRWANYKDTKKMRTVMGLDNQKMEHFEIQLKIPKMKIKVKPTFTSRPSKQSTSSKPVTQSYSSSTITT